MKRRLVLAGCSVLLFPLGVGDGADAADPQGRWLTPFREDGARYDAASGSFVGGRYAGSPTDGHGCVTVPSRTTGAPPEDPTGYDCVPAGASMVSLASGRVLYWNALEGEERVTGPTESFVTHGARYLVNDQSRVLDPVRKTFLRPSPVDGGSRNTAHPDALPLGPLGAQRYSHTTGSMFCSDQVFLRDGSVLVVGGTDYYSEPHVPVADAGVLELEGTRQTRWYDERSNTFLQGPSMHYGRWYPSLVTLGNGQVFVAGGVSKLVKPVYPSRPGESGTNVTRTETLTVGSARPQWVLGPDSASRSLPLYPRLHLLPNGHVLYDASGQAFNPLGQSYDEAVWHQAATYDPAAKKWTDLGIPGGDASYLAANPTSAPFAGFRGSTFSAALPLRPSSVRGGVPSYTSASFLTAGGVLGTTPGSYFPVAHSRITTVTTAGGRPSFLTTGAGDLGTPRWYGTATPLPNGQVFLSSGADVDHVALPGSESPIREAELFTPTVDAAGRYTGGSWRSAGSQTRKRTYHNNAVLLADGSVLIGGHAPIVTGYHETRDTPDLPVREGTNNHHDPSFQVWLPPYFSDPARPVVEGVTTSGRTVFVAMPERDARRVASVVLMRNTAQTHLIDGDARTVSLPVLARGRDGVVVGLPSTTNVLPAGPYRLFVNASKTADRSGRDAASLLPSRGVQVFVSGTSVPRVEVPAETQPSAPGKGKHKGHDKGKHKGRPFALPPARLGLL